MSLPSIQEACSSRDSLESALSTLLEPSTSLKEHLVPSLSSSISTRGGEQQPTSYAELVDLSEAEVASWSEEEKADFLGGHPRIGEVKNLSALSSKEQQGQAQPTPPEVLAKLETLNALYESRYPKLKYVTFVAGRSRAQVAKDLEAFLMQQPDAEKDTEGADASPTVTYPAGSKEWTEELERGLQDVFRIAKARLKGMGVE